MQKILGDGYHVIENGLGGRTTVFEDPFSEGRSGKAGLPPVLEAAAPIDLFIIMLGTNDCKKILNAGADQIAIGMEQLVQLVQDSSCGDPEILIASPVHIGSGWPPHALGLIFNDSSTKVSKELAPLFQWVAASNGCHFIDAALYARAADDNVHLDAIGHQALGRAFAGKVMEILNPGSSPLPKHGGIFKWRNSNGLENS